jgi:hypothetical protein
MRLTRRTPRIHHYHSTRLTLRNRHIPIAHAAKERPCLLLKTIFIMTSRSILRIALVPLPGPVHTGMRARIQQQRQIRLQISAQDPMQFANSLASQPPSVSLIGLGRVGKPVAQHEASRRQRRFDHFGDVLRARCKHQRHFRQRSQSRCPGMQQHLPNLLSRRRPPWLSSLDDLVSCRAQRRRKLAHLRALACAVKSLECDEFPTPRHEAKSYQRERHREFCSHMSRPAPAKNTHPDPKMIHLAIVILRCRSSIESLALEAGGLALTRNLPNQLQTRKSATAPTRQIATGKLTVTMRATI